MAAGLKNPFPKTSFYKERLSKGEGKEDKVY
jgi:hypothetical protein